MEVTIQLLTADGPGEIVFDFTDISNYVGRTVKVDIPDRSLRRRYNELVDGNPEGFVKSGGSVMPRDASKHFDVIRRILSHLLLEGFEGFAYTLPEVDTGVPVGDIRGHA